MPTIQLKSLKPKNLPTAQDYLDAYEKAAQKSAALVLRDLESTTRTWNHKVTFDVTTTRQRDSIIVAAGTDDEIYGYVDSGTKRHIIRPKRSKYLRFLGGYVAKTRVGIIGSQTGGAFGSAVFAAEVNHPGFPGRDFTKAIARRRQVTIEQETRQGIAKVAREAK